MVGFKGVTPALVRAQLLTVVSHDGLQRHDVCLELSNGPVEIVEATSNLNSIWKGFKHSGELGFDVFE